MERYNGLLPIAEMGTFSHLITGRHTLGSNLNMPYAVLYQIASWR